MQVKSDRGEVVQLTFSKYNKELLHIAYGSLIQENERYEKQVEQETKEQSADLTITDELVKLVEDTGTPFEIHK